MPNYSPMPVYADDPNEYFDTYTEQGEKLFPQKRGHVHANGIWHRAVNVFLYRSNGALVLQQRAASKSVCPLAWDLSVAEHLQVDERWEDAAHRGLAEELGINDVELTQCGPQIQERIDIPEEHVHNYEFQRCFRGVSDQSITIDAAEVAAVREISEAEFVKEVADTASDPKLFTPWLLEWARLVKLI